MAKPRPKIRCIVVFRISVIPAITLEVSNGRYPPSAVNVISPACDQRSGYRENAIVNGGGYSLRVVRTLNVQP
jgi:hypothetical protein